MYESEISDAIKQLQAGSIDAPTDLMKMALMPSTTPAQCQLITSALFAALDDFHGWILKTDKIFPTQHAFCLGSLGPIIVQCCLRSEWNSIVGPLLRHWEKLHQWVSYLKDNFMDRESVDFAVRLLVKNCIVDFLGICMDNLLCHMLDLAGCRGIIYTVLSLWHLETQDTRFYDSDKTIFHISGILDSCMSVFVQRERWCWPEILRPFGGDADTLATTALDHLRLDVVRTPINYDLIAWGTHLMTAFSINESIRIALLNQRSMTLLTNVVSSMVNQYAITDKHDIVARCISRGYWYIHTYVVSTYGLPWVAQIVEAGLLSAILSTEPWLKHLDGEDSEDWETVSLLLDEVIPVYSVYSSVLEPMTKQLTMIGMSGLPGKLAKNGLLFQLWSAFERTVRPRVILYNSTLSNVVHIESCQNLKCNRSGPLGSLKTCVGCHHVHYCSKECQVNDWKNGVHRKYCQDIKAHRAVGHISYLSRREICFIDRVIAQDLSFVRNQIHHAALIRNINPVVVQMDYTEVPVEVNISSIDTEPAMQTCHCDDPMSQKWHHIVELAQKSTSKKILVRALLPGGASGRVKLRCMPLKWILGRFAPTSNEERLLQFDETFDLLYSRVGRTLDLVGAAFPNEAIREANEMSQLGAKGEGAERNN